MSGTKIAMPQPNSFQSGALSFMSCTSGRESSPLDENDSHQTPEFKTETKKKRFHPLRNLRRMFRRKTRRSSISTESYQSAAVDSPEVPATALEQRSCSTSRLQEENLTQNLFRNSRLNPGLSLSHDSIFTPDRADSGLSSSDLENSSLSITVLTPPSKECPMKSQSSCSETSLLSIGSSEVELSPVRGGRMSELDVETTAYKLSHSAARHKMAVKPRRNHGAPSSRRRAMATKTSLPMTPEVSEEGAAGRNPPPLEAPPAADVSGNLPKCDKQTQDGKISWSDIAMDSVTKEPEEKGGARGDDEADAKEEEATTQRSESFFGRFLSRRSDKKKLQQEGGGEEGGEEKGNFVKRLSKASEGKGVIRKAPNRRQRVEPVEIPSTSKGDVGKDREDVPGRKLSGSVSPPKSYWPSQVTSRSMSPPKVIWSEGAAPHGAPDSVTPTPSDRPKTNVFPTNQSAENVVKDWKNPNFVKELTVSVSSFAREKSGKREKEEEEETVLKIRRQHSEDTTPRKPQTSADNPVVGKTTPSSPESVETAKSEESTPSDTSTPHSGCPKALNPFTFEAIHDGYENIQIIEQVKQEVRNSLEGQPAVAEGRSEPTPEPEKQTKPEVSSVRADAERLEMEVEVVRRVKPAVSEKPKELKRAGASPGWKEGRTAEEEQGRTERVVPRTRATLVERRKSELLLLTETEEKELKGRGKPLRKQTSFSEVPADGGAVESPERSCWAPERESSAEKTEPVAEVVEEVVVLRKKSVVKASDEQPELMKVFARRSLKVREGEKIGEEMQRSRDSDKENEVVESPKEERKKVLEGEERKEGEKGSSKEGARGAVRERSSEVKVVSVTPLKPEVAFRKSVLQRYGRSLSENNGKAKEEGEARRESVVLEENKLNKMKGPMEKVIAVKLEKEGEGGEAEEGVEIGFKRIQQRKAEWERRAQQGAK